MKMREDSTESFSHVSVRQMIVGDLISAISLSSSILGRRERACGGQNDGGIGSKTSKTLY
jgi:hypothetical protein